MRVLHLLLDLLEHLLHSPQLEGSRAGSWVAPSPSHAAPVQTGLGLSSRDKLGWPRAGEGGTLGCISRPRWLEQQPPAGCRKGGSCAMAGAGGSGDGGWGLSPLHTHLLILLPDELLRLHVWHRGDHGDGEVCPALPGQLAVDRERR